MFQEASQAQAVVHRRARDAVTVTGARRWSGAGSRAERLFPRTERPTGGGS